MIKKGDNVRFLNAVGGGKVTRVDESKKMVYVEDADGFEVPVFERECVLIEAINKETNFPIKDFKTKPTSTTDQKASIDLQPVSLKPEPPKVEPIIETPEGETLVALLAFFPIDIKQMQTTAYECYLVNDSNYYLYYNVVNGENEVRKSIANGLIEPNTQELLAEISKEQLSEWERIRIQLLPFKKDKSYTPQNVVDISLKINAVKFYKLHSFTTNDYFDEPAMLIDIASEKEKEDENKILADVSPEEIKQAMFQKEETGRPRIVKRKELPAVIEVDLHINELLDTTAGMSNGDMLQCQLDKFHAVLAENKNKKGQKIVFIHGKGEGVLRSEIEKLLKTQYKSYYFQDASFREYGFGATMVTIK
jgi:DNA-nicking Smr family endonuclease